jgi:hypothetical protein
MSILRGADLMKKMPRRTLQAAMMLACYAAAMTPAMAVDPVCNQFTAATRMLWKVPFHMYTTETQSFANQTMAKAAGQIGMGGTRQSEEISTGKGIYVLTRGRWIDMQTSFAAMEQDKDSDPDAKKAQDESKCQALPDEAMYGQAARVYRRSTPATGTDMKIWISKSANLPIRTDITHDQGAMKMLSVSRYEYSGVQAPEHAITMKDMIQFGGKR